MYGAIDVGTNTVRLLLYDEKTGEKIKLMRSTRIGEGLVQGGQLSYQGMERTRRAIMEYLELARNKDVVEPVYCYATSAVRQAANGPDFMEMIAGKKGLVSEIISSEMEAEYGYRGAIGQGDGVVIDIGGGSTEMAYGEKGKVLFRGSALMGCVSGLALYGGDEDRLSAPVMERMQVEYGALATTLREEVLGDKQVDALVGIGGTMTQLAMIKSGEERYSPEVVTGMELSAGELEGMLTEFCAMTTAERRGIPGMEPTRADVILPGCAIALSLVAATGVQRIIACDSDTLEGYLLQKIAEGN
ncbi:hypothetical protein LJC20_07125 [Eubacteriales bacterium OttesenSCG-928-M02]|nr:hypothetical protein [Eubacteriales bacterium OttesenSCG-928-M02]